MERAQSTVNDSLTYCSPADPLRGGDVYAFMEKVHELDVKVYSAEDAGEIMPMVDRYGANPLSYAYVWDEAGDRLAGYINFFPVNDILREMILKEDTPYSLLDDDISPDQIVPFEKDRSHFVYILSAVVDPEFQGTGVVRLLTDGVHAFLRKMHVSENIRIDALAACAVSADGVKLLNIMRFKRHHILSLPSGAPVTSESGFPKAIYICDNSDANSVTRAGSLSKLLHKGVDVSGKNASFYDFSRERFSPDGESGSEGEEYVKTWQDDVYLYLPMTEHAYNAMTDPLFAGAPFIPLDPDQPGTDDDHGIPVQILKSLEESIRYECSSRSITDMRTHYLGCYDFLHITDDYPCKDRSFDPIHDDLNPETAGDETIYDLEARIRKDKIYTYFGNDDDADTQKDQDNDPTHDKNREQVIGLQKGYVFITSHRPTHMYVVNVFFPDYRYSTTQLEDQVSNNYIKLVDPRVTFPDGRYDPFSHPECIRFIRLYDYLWQKYLLHKCGQEKIMVCMSNKPDQDVYRTEFQNIMSAEVYNSHRQDFHIDSPELKTICETDHSQYDYYSVYLSEMVIAFIPDDFGDIKDRIDITSTYSFIAELVMFQNTALARMNMKVSDLLYRNNNVTMDEVMQLEQEYGKTIPFWEPSNFNYIGTSREASCIKEAFSNEDLLKTYDKHQEYLEHMVDLMSSERENRNSMILNIAATVLAIIQVESFVTGMLGRFYERIGIELAPRYTGFEVTFSNTLLGALLLIIVYLIIHNNRIKRERRLRDGKRRK